ncbi:type III secretion system chaperone [Acidovorax sp. Leaf78]|uniref:type III secretion system chaperone n=1 Tax=unclassified Acidovorax TaxID=2684926 RepID=UPI0006F773B0|nr:type III secretion system chaperone [Acidovorax sp. Leaf78]KQO14825.1 hypothetical protein ASF16_17585 [Acidovorax sp. Leaf78]
MSTADQLLLDLGQTAGLSQTLRFDAQGCARLVFDTSLAIDFERDDDARVLQVYSVLGPLPAQGREALYRRLLEANLFGAATAGATLAVDGHTQEVVLCRTVDVEETGGPAFVRLVEGFVAVAEDWKKLLLSGGGAESPVPSAGSGLMPGGMMSVPLSGFLRA